MDAVQQSAAEFPDAAETGRIRARDRRPPCRALAQIERESAEKISDPALRAPVRQRA